MPGSCSWGRWPARSAGSAPRPAGRDGGSRWPALGVRGWEASTGTTSGSDATGQPLKLVSDWSPGPGRCPSAAREPGLARPVLEERGDADAGVLGAEHLGEELLLQGEAVGQRPVEALVDGPQGQRLGEVGTGGEGGRPGQGPVEDVARGDHLVHEADGQRLGGPQLAPAEDEVLGPGGTHQAGQALGPTPAGDDAEQDLGLAEAGVLGGDAQVAGQSQLAPAAQGEP